MAISTVTSILLIGIASNIDNGGVGVTYGIRSVQVGTPANLIIALISFVATLVSGFCGDQLTTWISPLMGSVLGAAVLIIVGVVVLIQPFLKNQSVKRGSRLLGLIRNPERADFNQNQRIGIGESIVLGVALSMNALAGGLDAGLTNLSIVKTAVSVGVFSYIALWLGTSVGLKIAQKHFSSQTTTVVAGVLLIFIGIHQLM